MSEIVTREPAISFNQAVLKIELAKVLLRNLEEECDAFIKDKPYHVSFKYEPKAGGYLFDVGLFRHIPPQIPCLIGDICGNLRASLDYAWMGLVRRENPGNPRKRTMPIADNGKGLIGTIAQSPIQGAIKEAETLLVDRIKAHRDFANGGNQPIIALNELSNWNKHNLLLTAIGVTEIRGVKISGSAGRVSMDRLQVRGGICTQVAYQTGTPPDLTYEGEPAVEVLFGDHDFVKHEPVLPTLVNLAQAALQALKAFCEVFPDPLNPRFIN